MDIENFYKSYGAQELQKQLRAAADSEGLSDGRQSMDSS